MSEKFVASNGVEVGKLMHGWQGEVSADDFGLMIDGVSIGTPGVKALREFFRHERDTELGRWRWPEKPEYVVYPKNPSAIEPQHGVRVVCEETGRARDLKRDVVSSPAADLSVYGQAARAYFAAHPEMKPWERAEVGEVWVLTYRNLGGGRTTQPAMRTGSGKWRIPLGEYDFMDPIVSARRIFPEVVSDDS